MKNKKIPKNYKCNDCVNFNWCNQILDRLDGESKYCIKSNMDFQLPKKLNKDDLDDTN